jgi:hypothetical protein
VDFFQDWASARNYLNGFPIYADHRTAVERYLGYHIDTVNFEVNAHPPTSVLLVLPLAGLDYPDAVLVWNLISLGTLLISLWLIARALRVPLRPWSVFPLVAILLVCTPFRQELLQGQFNLVLLLLLTAVWTAERSGRPTWAGALLGVATAIKFFPIVLFLYFLLRGRWRAAAAGAISLGAVTLLTAAVLGTDTYLSYVNEVLPHVRQYRSGWNNASLPGLWVKLFNPASELERVEPFWRSPLVAESGALLSSLAVVAALAWAVWKARKRPTDDRGFGLAVTAMLLISPLTWQHYFLLLLVPVAVLWVRLPSSALPRALFMVVLIALCMNPVVLYDAFIPGGYGHGTAGPVHTLLVLSIQCYALLGLFALGLAVAEDRDRVRVPDEPGQHEQASCERESHLNRDEDPLVYRTPTGKPP